MATGSSISEGRGARFLSMMDPRDGQTPYPCPICAGETRDFHVAADGRQYRKCRNCEGVFLIAAQRLTRTQEHAQYLLHNNDPGDVNYRHFLNQLLKPLLSAIPGARSGLDYGCGPGPALAFMLREMGHSVELYDPFFCDQESVLRKTYDFITCSEVVEHFHRPAEEFSRFDRMIRPGGVIGIMTGMLTDDIDFPGWHYRRDPTHVLFYTPQTMRYLASRHSWRCEFPAKNVTLFFKV